MPDAEPFETPDAQLVIRLRDKDSTHACAHVYAGRAGETLRHVGEITVPAGVWESLAGVDRFLVGIADTEGYPLRRATVRARVRRPG